MFKMLKLELKFEFKRLTKALQPILASLFKKSLENIVKILASWLEKIVKIEVHAKIVHCIKN